MKNCRRLELAVQPGGWRGNVEDIIAKEMQQERRSREKKDDKISGRRLMDRAYDNTDLAEQKLLAQSDEEEKPLPIEYMGGNNEANYENGLQAESKSEKKILRVQQHKSKKTSIDDNDDEDAAFSVSSDLTI